MSINPTKINFSQVFCIQVGTFNQKFAEGNLQICFPVVFYLFFGLPQYQYISVFQRKTTKHTKINFPSHCLLFSERRKGFVGLYETTCEALRVFKRERFSL